MRNLNAYCRITVALLLILFLISGCGEKINESKPIGSQESLEFTEYIKLSKEFYSNYFIIAEEDEKSKGLDMLLKGISKHESRIVKMGELLENIKQVVPESKISYYEKMELRYHGLKKLYEYSQKDFNSLTSKEKREVGLERSYLILNLDYWREGEEYSYKLW